MSARWRNNRRVMVAAPPPVDIVSNHIAVDDSYMEDDEGFIGTSFEEIQNSPAFPGPREMYHPEALGYTPNRTPVGTIRDNIDWEIGGQAGEINDLPYSLGVVSSDGVENFAMTGEQAIIRRGKNPSDTGPVGTSDHNMLLALAYQQTVNQYYPNERSQASLIREV